jgi:adenine-specific DNA-methyltransferase
MKLDDAFNREGFLKFVGDLIPEIVHDVREIELENSRLSSATQLARSEKLDLQIIELKVSKNLNNRVSITRDAFKLMKKYGSYNALVVFRSDADQQWRLSLMTARPVFDNGNILVSLSNPRRNSYLLGPGSKIKTPSKFLVSQGQVKDISSLQDRFSIEVVNKEFFDEVAGLYRELVGDHSSVENKGEMARGVLDIPEKVQMEAAKQEFAVRLIGRLVFSWFLREKKSDQGRPLLPESFFHISDKKESYYQSQLEPLFFETLNKSIEDRETKYNEEPFNQVPYLNGGLFYPKNGHGGDYYKSSKGGSSQVKIPNEWFKKFYAVLNRFNFTVDENSSFDTDLSVDPEMLGRIFENLLAEINPDTGEAARKSTGSFYTPRTVVDYMVDRTLVHFLIRKTDIESEKIEALLTYDELDDENNLLTSEDKHKIAMALQNFKVLDPACGSGAFPIGILQKIVWVQQQIDPFAEIWLENQLSGLSPELQKHLKRQMKNKNFDYLRKLSVIRDTIYGVDIQPIATEMSRLRCFLTLIVEEQVRDDEVNRGIQPLPNLEFKFITGNSLMDLSEVNDSTSDYPSMFDDVGQLNDLREIRNRYFTSTGKSRSKMMDSFSQIQAEMRSSLNTIQFGATSKAFKKLADWDPFGVDGVDWFDSEWMFGVKSFDAVICNPPYVGEKGHKDMFREIRTSGLRDHYLGKMDLFYFFFHLALDKTAPGAIITFITTNYYPTAAGARKLRNDLKSRSTVLEIVNFNEMKIFESALGQHNMITLIEKGKQECDAKFNVIHASGSATSNNLEEILYNTTPQNLIFSLGQKEIFDGAEAYIRFPTNGMDATLEVLERLPRHLIDICNINNGLQSGADRFSEAHGKKYPKIKAVKGDGIFQVSLTEAKALSKPNHLKLFFKNSDIGRWIVKEDARSKVLYLQRDDSPTMAEMSHLIKYKSILEKRRGVNDKSIPWWALSWPRTKVMFEGPKIVCPQRSAYNKFALSMSPWYASGDVYYITPKFDSVDLGSILGLLNSKLYFAWLYNRGKRKGEALELYQVPLSEIPIPNLLPKQSKVLSSLVESIIEFAGLNDDQNRRTSERKLDNEVYKIFELTENQIEAIEEFWSQKSIRFSAIDTQSGVDLAGE